MADFTTGQVAEILRISRSTAQRLVDKGYLPGYRLTPDSPRKVKEKDLRQYVAENALEVEWPEEIVTIVSNQHRSHA